MNYPCDRKWFQWLEKVNRPATRWGFSIAAVGYAARAVIGLPFEETYFLALAGVAGFTYWQRGAEKLKEKELEQ